MFDIKRYFTEESFSLDDWLSSRK